MSSSGLSLEGVCHSYDRHEVVCKVSLEVGTGEIVCLLGPSGCGKSTVLRIAAGLEPLQRGRVLIGGRIVADENTAISPEARGVGLVFQDFALFPHLNVLDNVVFGVTAPSSEDRYAIALKALDQVALKELAQAYPHTLSGGEQQRVALARALAPAPIVMLLDEPFASLDVRLRDQVRDDTLALLKQTGTPTLLVTHDPEEAMRMADRIAVMRAGRLVQTGRPGIVYDNPTCAFVAKFFSEINELEGIVKNGSVLTALGSIDVEGLAEGCSVSVLVRPEAIRLDPSAGVGVAARVCRSRALGPYSRIELVVADRDRPLIARSPGAVVAEPGSDIGVTLDARQVFVFADTDRG